MEYTTGSLPRFCAVFVPQAQKLQALDVGLYPIFAVALIGHEVIHQIRAQGLQFGVIHEFCEVFVEIWVGVRLHMDSHIIHVDVN